MDLISITKAQQIKNCDKRTIYNWIRKGAGVMLNFFAPGEIAGHEYLIVNDEKFQQAKSGPQGRPKESGRVTALEQKVKELEEKLKDKTI